MRMPNEPTPVGVSRPGKCPNLAAGLTISPASATKDTQLVSEVHGGSSTHVQAPTWSDQPSSDDFMSASATASAAPWSRSARTLA